MKQIDKDLAEVKKYIGSTNPEDRVQFEQLFSKIAENYTSDADQLILDRFVSDGLLECQTDIEKIKTEINIKEQLKEITEIVSLSYISRNYFKKTRTWLYQKINGNIINGKPACLTSEEFKVLQFAIKDISSKLGSLQLSMD